MKVYITGTTRGLGRALKKELSKLSMEVVSLDRPDYDLANYHNDQFDKFVKDDFAIFINCATYEYAQTELLYRLAEANKDRECHIINIGSVSSDGDRMAVNKYAIEKTALEKACTQLSLINSKCKISLVKPGRMSTDMTKHITAPKLDPREVARTITWVIMQPKHINIKSMSIDIMQDLK
jgi:NADP-dependent 3-hydroxy acid dehydrogenase YdfG